jgi:hypothetical protein
MNFNPVNKPIKQDKKIVGDVCGQQLSPSYWRVMFEHIK